MRKEYRSLPCITKVKSTLFLIFVHWLCSLVLIYLDSFIISCKCYFMVKGSVTHLNQEQTCIFFSVLLMFYKLKQFTSHQLVLLFVIVFICDSFTCCGTSDSVQPLSGDCLQLHLLVADSCTGIFMCYKCHFEGSIWNWGWHMYEYTQR